MFTLPYVGLHDTIISKCRPRMHEIDVKLIAYDDDKSQLKKWADIILGNNETAKYVWGLGLHWYAGDFIDQMSYGALDVCILCATTW